MSRKLIYGLHGLSNKPPEAQLREWWWKSITDGVHFHRGANVSPELSDRNAILPWDDFQIIYWADLMYWHPNVIANMNEPYIKINGKPPDRSRHWYDAPRRLATDQAIGWWDRIRGRLGRLGYDRLINAFLKEKIQDLHAYWQGEVTRDVRYWEADEWHDINRRISANDLRGELGSHLLWNVRSEGYADILVIAHSMGSIIAYDTIMGITELQGNPITLITIGSPLGLPTVRSHLEKKPGEKKPIYPENKLKAWYNFADFKDLVAAIPYLSPHFKDASGAVRIEDRMIRNDFRDKEGKINSHKSFGYLRSPEVGTVVSQFLVAP